MAVASVEISYSHSVSFKIDGQCGRDERTGVLAGGIATLEGIFPYGSFWLAGLMIYQSDSDIMRLVIVMASLWYRVWIKRAVSHGGVGP